MNGVVVIVLSLESRILFYFIENTEVNGVASGPCVSVGRGRGGKSKWHFVYRVSYSTIISVALTPKNYVLPFYSFLIIISFFFGHINCDVLLTQCTCICSDGVIRAISLLERFFD